MRRKYQRSLPISMGFTIILCPAQHVKRFVDQKIDIGDDWKARFSIIVIEYLALLYDDQRHQQIVDYLCVFFPMCLLVKATTQNSRLRTGVKSLEWDNIMGLDRQFIKNEEHLSGRFQPQRQNYFCGCSSFSCSAKEG